MTESDPLLVERPSDDIAVLRINRPAVRNALNLAVRQRIAAEMTQAAADPAVRVVVITGNEKAFAAGADITEMADADPIAVMARNVQQYWRPITECPKPVIAAIEGFALGGNGGGGRPDMAQAGGPDGGKAEAALDAIAAALDGT